MNDVSLAGAFLAGLISFLSPCVLPLVPGYISMLSGIGMEQLRNGEARSAGLFSSALAFVAGLDRKSTRLNSSHANISYAVFCLKKKKRPNCGGGGGFGSPSRCSVTSALAVP